MREVAALVIIFENMETVGLTVGDSPDCDVKTLSVSDIYPQIDNGVECYLSDHIVIVLNEAANRNFDGLNDSKKTLFDRLEQKDDIVGLKILFSDGTSRELSPPWSSEEDDENEFQESFWDMHTGLYGIFLIANEEERSEVKECFIDGQFNHL